MGFGENVKKLIDEKGIKQNELARKIGMSSSGICTALAPNGNPRENTIRAIAAALGCRPGVLMDDPADSASAQPEDYHEKELLDIFRQLTGEGQGLLLKNAKDYLNTPSLRKNASISSMG